MLFYICQLFTVMINIIQEISINFSSNFLKGKTSVFSRLKTE